MTVLSHDASARIHDRAPARSWIKPTITRIEAGSAENAAGPRRDDRVNFS